MIALLAAGILASTPRFLIIGGALPTAERAELKSLLGDRVELRFGEADRLPAHLNPQLVIYSPANLTQSPFWEKELDEFVPATKRQLARIGRSYPASKKFVLLDEARTETESTELVPLLSQAARESGWSVLNLNSAALAGSRVRKMYTLLLPVERNPGSWRVVAATSEETDEGPAKNAIDSDPNTYWHTRWSSNPTRVPHEIEIDLGASMSLAGFSYLPRQDGGVNGRIKDFELFLSNDKDAWGSPVLKGEMKNTAAEQRMLFEKPIPGRFLKLRALSEVNGNPWTTCAELGVLPAGG